MEKTFSRQLINRMTMWILRGIWLSWEISLTMHRRAIGGWSQGFQESPFLPMVSPMAKLNVSLRLVADNSHYQGRTGMSQPRKANTS